VGTVQQRSYHLIHPIASPLTVPPAASSQGQTSAYVRDTDWAAGERGGGHEHEPERVPARYPDHPRPASSYPRSRSRAESDDDYDDDDDDSDSNVSIDAFARRSRAAAAAAAAASSPEADSRPGGDGTGHLYDEDENDYHSPTEEVEGVDGSSWIDVAAGHFGGAWTRWGGGGQRKGAGEEAKARRLERERDHLAREVHKLNAQLEEHKPYATVTSASGNSSRLGRSDLDENPLRRSRSSDATSASTSAFFPLDTPQAQAPPGTWRRQGQAAAVKAAGTAERVSRVDGGPPRDRGPSRQARSRRDHDSNWPTAQRRSPVAKRRPDASPEDSGCGSATSSSSSSSGGDGGAALGGHETVGERGRGQYRPKISFAPSRSGSGENGEEAYR